MPNWISYSSLIPPNLFIFAALLGTLLAWRTRQVGLWLVTAAVGSIYLLSMPVAAYWLIRATEAFTSAVPAASAPTRPGAIIVLSADARTGSAPGEADRAGPVTLERLAEAARLQRRLGLPILVSGGRIAPFRDSLAGVMSRALQDDFRVPVRWREDRSRNTYENAVFSAAILRRAAVPAALVVTHPWHMARALWSFDAARYPVIAAPTPGAPVLPASAAILLPQVPSLHASDLALHELIGLAWYVCRYRHR